MKPVALGEEGGDFGQQGVVLQVHFGEVEALAHLVGQTANLVVF